MTAIRLEKAWKRWPIGHVIPDMPAGQASELIKRGIARADGGEPKRGLAFASPANRMIAPEQMRKKKA